MILITDKAEEKLLKSLSLLRERGITRRCLRISLAHHSAEDFVQLLNVVNVVVDDPDGMIFECADGDVYVLALGMTMKVVEQLLSPPSMQLSYKTPAPFVESAVLFDTAVQGRELVAEIESKIEEIHALDKIRREQQEQDKKEKLRRMVLEMDVPSNHGLSYDRRRAEREKSVILIVEDDTFTRTLVANTIKAQTSAVQAADGYHAVVEYARHAPDVVFLDIDLPDVNGFDLLSKLLAVDPQAFIVMLSGNSQKSNILKAIQSGAKGFVGKPFTREKIMQYASRRTKSYSIEKEISHEVHP